MVKDFSALDLHAPHMFNTEQKDQGSLSPTMKRVKPQVSMPGGLKNVKAKNSNGARAQAFANSKKN